MDARLFFAAIAAAGLVGLDAIFTATTVPIEGRYSKASLDEICAAVGGKGYGSVGKAYGCSKESITVECRNDGACNGYVYFRREADIPAAGDPLALLGRKSERGSQESMMEAPGSQRLTSDF